MKQTTTMAIALVLLAATGGVLAAGELTVMPVDAPASSPFGVRTDPIRGHGRQIHPGIDLLAKLGTPVKAAGDGVVIGAGWMQGYGYAVLIDHGGGLTSLYGHLSRINVKKGSVIVAGVIIGKVGATGWATGPHLHFEVRRHGHPVSPLAQLRRRKRG